MESDLGHLEKDNYLDNLKTEICHLLFVLWVVFEVFQLSLLGEIVDLRTPVPDRG